MAFRILMPGRAIKYLAKRFCRVIPVARYGFFEGGVSALDNGLVHVGMTQRELLSGPGSMPVCKRLGWTIPGLSRIPSHQRTRSMRSSCARRLQNRRERCAVYCHGEIRWPGACQCFYVAQVCERFGRLKMAARPYKIPRDKKSGSARNFITACLYGRIVEAPGSQAGGGMTLSLRR